MAGIYVNGDNLNPIEFPSDVNIINNLIYSNISEYNGAGIYFDNLWINANINNNTISKNYSSSNPIGNAFYYPIRHESNIISVVNNIMFYNDEDCQIYYPDYNLGEFTYNDIMFLGCQIDPQDNYDFNPEFIDFYNNDFRLSSFSPLINLGDNNVYPITSEDIIHNSRFIDQIDVGAYEKGDSYFSYSTFKTNTNIYPNPASDLINIDSEFLIDNIEILNTKGQVVNSFDKILNYNYTVDISNLSNGVYLIKLMTQSSTEFYKFIKQ